MKKLTIVFIELGMLGGIVIAAYTVPERTPLLTFLVASSACFIAGNALLIVEARRVKAGEDSSTAVWVHILRAIALVTLFSLIALIFRR
jgi:hypothetical protein